MPFIYRVIRNYTYSLFAFLPGPRSCNFGAVVCGGLCALLGSDVRVSGACLHRADCAAWPSPEGKCHAAKGGVQRFRLETEQREAPAASGYQTARALRHRSVHQQRRAVRPDCAFALFAARDGVSFVCTMNVKGRIRLPSFVHTEFGQIALLFLLQTQWFFPLFVGSQLEYQLCTQSYKLKACFRLASMRIKMSCPAKC